ncbi:MAG: hypothetical protein COW33_04385, partial [Anaerolineae bacterium CG17_big_fil_post_rev_8_21_14_2_50_57_27]
MDDVAQIGNLRNVAYDLRGERVRQFLDYTVSSDLSALEPGKSQATKLVTPKGEVTGALTCVDPTSYRLTIPAAKAGLAAAWLRDLSDGYTSFNLDGQPDGTPKRMPGPVVVMESKEKGVEVTGKPVSEDKPWFIGVTGDGSKVSLPTFEWKESESPLRRTPLYEVHKSLGAKVIPFAGWEMPVWYSSVLEEHL